MLESNGLEILIFLLQDLVIATLLKLDIHRGFLQVILTPKDAKLPNEGRQERKGALSQEVCYSVWSAPENDLGRVQRWFASQCGWEKPPGRQHPPALVQRLTVKPTGHWRSVV